MKSLKVRVLLSFVAAFSALALIFSLGLNTYIESRYYHQKIDKMIQTGNQIRMQLQMANTDSEIKEGLDYLGYQFEGRITLVDITADRALILYKNQRYIYNQGTTVREIRYGDQTAVVIRTNYPVANSLWLGYLSQIDETRFAWLEIPVITIDETLEVFRSYIWKGLALGFAVSLVVAYWLARSITDPVAQLSQLAGKIGRLEFDAVYTGRRTDEIGQLGATLNEITQILKKTISDLTAELSKKQQLEKLRKRFVAQVSHELQTPISVISSYAEALSDGLAEPPEEAEYYEIILDECQKMSKVVKELLDLSGLESGLTEYKKEEIDLAGLVGELVKKQEWIVKAEDKEISLQLAPVSLWGDAFRLEQAISNILSNSIKHAARRIDVNLTRTAEEAVLLVRNDGALIEPADLPYIWDSFYKGKDKKSGTGLGLAIASEIFKAQQVKYRVYNDDINKEVVYELIFPLAQNFPRLEPLSGERQESFRKFRGNE